MAFIGWTPEQVKKVIEEVGSKYDELGPALANDVTSSSDAVKQFWIGADSTKGRQVLACQLDASYKVMVRGINGLIATLYNIAASWEYKQKHSSFGSQEASSDTEDGSIGMIDVP